MSIGDHDGPKIPQSEYVLPVDERMPTIGNAMSRAGVSDERDIMILLRLRELLVAQLLAGAPPGDLGDRLGIDLRQRPEIGDCGEEVIVGEVVAGVDTRVRAGLHC